MKKIARAISAVCAAAALLSFAGCKGSEDTVTVQSVAIITGAAGVGLEDKYAGVVIAGNTQEIDFDQSLTLGEILVEEGQEVSAGDVLFTYDNEALNLALEQAELEIEGMKNTITGNSEQIAELERERNSAPESQKLQYKMCIRDR